MEITNINVATPKKSACQTKNNVSFGYLYRVYVKENGYTVKNYRIIRDVTQSFATKIRKGTGVLKDISDLLKKYDTDFHHSMRSVYDTKGTHVRYLADGEEEGTIRRLGAKKRHGGAYADEIYYDKIKKLIEKGNFNPQANGILIHIKTVTEKIKGKIQCRKQIIDAELIFNQKAKEVMSAQSSTKKIQPTQPQKSTAQITKVVEPQIQKQPPKPAPVTLLSNTTVKKSTAKKEAAYKQGEFDFIPQIIQAQKDKEAITNIRKAWSEHYI